MPRVVVTMIGARQLGRTWRNRIQGSRTPERPAGLDVLLLLDREHAAPDQPGVDRDPDDGDGARDLHGADEPRRGREDDHQDDGEQVDREGEDEVHRPHHHGVDPPAVVPGDQPEGHADEEGEQHRRHADQQRDPGAVDHAAQHVAPELVGPERIVPARALEGAGSGRWRSGSGAPARPRRARPRAAPATIPAPISAVVLLPQPAHAQDERRLRRPGRRQPGRRPRPSGGRPRERCHR